MPSNIELVAGNTIQVRVIDPLPLCPFNHSIKALAVKIVHDEKSGFIQIDCHYHL